MDARDIKEIDSEQLELIRQMEQYLSCPCHLIRPADEDGDIMETYWEARRRGERQGFVPVLVRCDDLLLEGMLGQRRRGVFGQSGGGVPPQSAEYAGGVGCSAGVGGS